jgi:beta-glucosidase
MENGVATVMTSFSSWQGVKISGNKGLVTDILKDRMNFGGFVVTDWNAHGQVAGCSNASCPVAANAGIDMFMAPDSWRALYASTLAQVKDGTIPIARLDDAVLRILRVKQRLGLFDAGKPSARAYSGRYELLGAPEHRAVAREAVRKSLVLLKNTGVLPLKPQAHILVAGDGADDIARQSGGWTLSWQGTGLDNSDFPGATSLWRGIEQNVAAAGGSAELAPDGDYKKRPDAAIVVFGETPYAEFQGDIPSLQLRPELRRPFATMRKLKAAGIPVVAVMITGRPLFVNEALNEADAFVTAWLPGAEGGGVADLLFARKDGNVAFDFQGRLPTAWPATARHDGPTLFPFGYGLTYAEGPQPWKTLSQDSQVADDGSSGGVYFDKGRSAASWSLTVSEADGDDPLRVTTVPATGLSGRATVHAVDHEVQESARQFVIAAGRDGATVEINAQNAVDLSRETNGDVMLLATLRLDAAPSAPVFISVRCDGADCGRPLRLPELASLPSGQWRVLGVPLKCFAATGADMTRITAPFRVSTGGSLNISLSRVALGSGMEADVITQCALD